MNNEYDAPARRSRTVRWGIGITLAGFMAGGGLAALAMTGGTTSPGSGTATTGAVTSADNAELNALLSASTAPSPGSTRIGPLRRLRGIGGYYGSLTFRTKAGVQTVAFERGTIESVSGGDVVVRAPDGTTMTWLLVSNTVVRDHGKASTSVLSDGQLVFVGGPVVNGARDARLVVVRTGKAPSAASPSTTPSPGTGTGTNAS